MHVCARLWRGAARDHALYSPSPLVFQPAGERELARASKSMATTFSSEEESLIEITQRSIEHLQTIYHPIDGLPLPLIILPSFSAIKVETTSLTVWNKSESSRPQYCKRFFKKFNQIIKCNWSKWKFAIFICNVRHSKCACAYACA